MTCVAGASSARLYWESIAQVTCTPSRTGSKQ